MKPPNRPEPEISGRKEDMHAIATQKPEELDGADEALLCAFLAQVDPQVPPPGLIESIEEATSHAVAESGRSRQRPPSAWQEARWAVEGPLLGLRAVHVPNYGREQALEGVMTLRYALGPLAPSRPLRLLPRRGWWLRQAVRLWK